MELPTFTTLRKHLKRDFAGLPEVRVALLGDAPTQWLAQALRGLGFERGLDVRVLDAGIDQLEAQILDPGSELWASNPRHVVLYTSVEAWLARFAAMPPADRPHAADEALARLTALWAAIADRAPGATVIQLTLPEVDDGVWGSYAGKTRASARYQLRKLNMGLMDAAIDHGHVLLADLAALQARLGRAALHDPRLAYGSHMALSMDALPAVADLILNVASAADGRVRKALVLDLDDTLWGGIVGEDGVEGLQVGDTGVGAAFRDVQAWARQLKQRGILLAVASKNDDAIAREPFDRHPEMVLSLQDFAAFEANWGPKVESLRAIATALNLGLDALVFLDDNPFERAMVRELLPMVAVPELPADPGDRPAFLAALGLFETAAHAADDGERTLRIRATQAAEAARARYDSVEAFLASLGMQGEAAPVTGPTVPRVAQLTQRSNQFNLRTVRYTEAEIARLAASPDHVALAFSLRDMHADHGLIGVVIGAKRDDGTLFLDTWLMSCRVLKRGMERFMLDAVVVAARDAGLTALVGEYLPTAKNGLVQDLLPGLGFTRDGDLWRLDLAGYEPRPTFIAGTATPV